MAYSAITVFPYELKLVFVVESNTFIRDVKQYIQDSVRGFNTGFSIGKLTTDNDYILLNDQKIGDIVDSGSSLLAYSSDYKIDSKILGGRSNPKHYLGVKKNKDEDQSEIHTQQENKKIESSQVKSIQNDKDKQKEAFKNKGNQQQKDVSLNINKSKKVEKEKEKDKDKEKEKEKEKEKKPKIIKKEDSEDEDESQKDEDEEDDDEDIIPPAQTKLSTIKKNK